MKRDFPKHRLPPLEITRPSDPHHQGLPLPHPLRPQPPGRRQPVIIHTYSPEVIPVDSDNFRQLVQRLTGPGSHTPPPRKRARFIEPARFVEPAPANPNSRPEPYQIAPPPYRPGISPRGGEGWPPLPHNPLLSPSRFEVSPTVLPSPSAYFPDYAAIISPRLLRGAPAGGLPGPSPRSLAAALPSPGPLTMSFLADLPALSPATYGWIGGSAEPILGSRQGLPPRPHPTITANLFPQTPPAPLDYYEEDEKPFRPYRDRLR